MWYSLIKADASHYLALLIRISHPSEHSNSLLWLIGAMSSGKQWGDSFNF